MGRRIRSNLTKSRSETRRAGDDGVADPKEGKERQNATEPAPKLSEAQRRLQHLEKVVASLVDANTAPLEIRDQPTPLILTRPRPRVCAQVSNRKLHQRSCQTYL